jgi:hypothetical protein
MKHLALGRTTGSHLEWDDRFRAVQSPVRGGQIIRGLGLALERHAAQANEADTALMLWAPDSAPIDSAALSDFGRPGEIWHHFLAVDEHVLMETDEYDDSAVLRLGFLSRVPGTTPAALAGTGWTSTRRWSWPAIRCSTGTWSTS